MARKLTWIAISLIVMLSLLLASCSSGTTSNTPTAPATTTAPTTSAPTTPAAATTTAPPTTAAAGDPTALTGTNLAPVPFKKDTVAGAATPKRGGTITTALLSDISAWDPMKAQAIIVGHMFNTSNKMMQGDWTKGPQGSGQTAWEWGFVGDIGFETGALISSWELPDPTTIIYHLKQGIKFHNKPPVNGREMTADDVVWSINYQFNTPTAWQYMAYHNSGLEPSKIEAVDKYTVKVTVPATSRDIMVLEIGDNLYVSPHEVWDNGGNMSDWTKIIGSGPWIMTDYVAGSTITYSANKDYFEKDPLHPDQAIPYADTFKQLIIVDKSTRLTALRTGKLDFLREITPDDALPILQSSGAKDLLWSRRMGIGWVANGRFDQKPFDDIRVRQALNMAVDKVSILKDYYKGQGALLGYPYHPTPGYSKLYTPLDKMPADVQMLYKYDPVQAKKLLADAGYPNGFSTTLQYRSDLGDEVAMVKNYLDQVGVNMTLKPLDTTAFNTVDAANDFTGMWYGQAKGIWAPHEMLMTKKGMYSNKAHIDDPYYVTEQQIIAQNISSNPDKMFAAEKDAGVHELQSAWAIFTPTPMQYNIWWPWLQNYYGINWTGWAGVWQWVKYLWVDQNLKKSMGY